MRTWIGKAIKIGAIAAAALFVAIQLVPYGRDHDNPPVTGEPRLGFGRDEAARLRRVLLVSFKRNRMALVLEYRPRVVDDPAGCR
jgi:hypothetical protein